MAARVTSPSATGSSGSTSVRTPDGSGRSATRMAPPTSSSEMSATTWSGMEPGLATMVRLNMAWVTVPFSRSTRVASPSSTMGTSTSMSASRSIRMKSTWVTVRFTGLRWSSLTMVRCSSPSRGGGIDALSPASVVGTWRSSRQSTATALGSDPRPYTTPGILPSARRRLDDRLPVGRPVSAVRVSSAMRRCSRMCGAMGEDARRRRSRDGRPSYRRVPVRSQPTAGRPGRHLGTLCPIPAAQPSGSLGP